MTDYFDLRVSVEEKEFKETVDIAQRLGWSGIALVKKTQDLNEFLKFKDSVSKLRAQIKTWACVELHPTKDVQNLARKFRKDTDIIYVSGDDSTNRAASECLEVDCISSPVKPDQKDFMHQKNSGIDYTIARSCAERGIAVEVNFSEIINYYGKLGSQLMARIQQNVKICSDTKTPVIMTSGATNPLELRAPREIMAVGNSLGLDGIALSKVPLEVIGKTDRRNNPNIIIKGLEIQNWGDTNPKEKKLYGWY